jgi:hypothetical protein
MNNFLREDVVLLGTPIGLRYRLLNISKSVGPSASESNCQCCTKVYNTVISVRFYQQQIMRSVRSATNTVKVLPLLW